MNFYPSFANFPAQTGNTATFNTPKTSFEYLSGYNNAVAFDGHSNAGNRGDKKQASRNRGPKN
jgi:hypothetical protein